MAGIEFDNQDHRVQKLIENFDLNLERNLDFDVKVCFNSSDQNHKDERNLKDLLDEFSQSGHRWDRISASCRRIIICDRELDLEKGLDILEKSLSYFKDLLNQNDDLFIKREEASQIIVENYNDKIFEIIRYLNASGLLSYRSGDYSKALNFFELAENIARKDDSFSSYFIPDTTSNRIRTKFEFFSQVLPSQISEDYVNMYGRILIDFINSYEKEICYWEDRNFEQEGEIENWIYGHGMASLYHNLAEAYSTVLKVNNAIKVPTVLQEIFEKYATQTNNSSLQKAIDKWKNNNFERDEEIKKLIYGHGKESLYHSLVEACNTEINLKNAIKIPALLQEFFEKYSIEKDNLSFQNRLRSEAFKNRLKSEDLNTIFKDYSKEANESSLKYGKKSGDMYRQLQSKNALRRLGHKSFEKDILAGKWERGKMMVYQDKIQDVGKELTTEEVKQKAKELKHEAEEIIDKGIKEGCFKIKGLRDKVGMLYNLSSVQSFMKDKPIDSILIGDEEFTPFSISYSKVKIAEELRSIFSAVLYKRQVMKQIREDISLITNEYIKRGEYPKALNFSEYYNNRGLVDLSTVEISKKNTQLKEKIKEIDSLKREVYTSMELAESNQLGRKSTHLALNDETNEGLLKLVLAYENMLKDIEVNEDTRTLETSEADLHIISEVLTKIAETVDTLIVKFSVIEVNKNIILRVFLLDNLTDKNNIKKPKELTFSKKDYEAFISAVKKALKIYDEEYPSSFSDREVNNEMAWLSNQLNLQENLDNIKNIFIIPDGELFQIPLHLLGQDGEDLRVHYQVYYAPSLLHLTGSKVNRVAYTKKENNYLWLFSPTRDLSTLEEPLAIPEISKQKNTIIEFDNGTLDNFETNFKPNEYTHVGFSTHACFQNNMATAYVSLLALYDSFLTTYDILLLMDCSGIETIFIGACSGASNKYTDENEAVGLVTAFLSKGVFSVIAPLCPISFYIHDEFIDLINNSNVITNSQSWNLDTLNIFKNLNPPTFGYFVPFVQYTSLDIIKNKAYDKF